VVTVNVDVAVPLATGVTEVKLNPQITVALTGATAQVRPTAELKPFNDVTVMVEAVLFPAIVMAVAGVALKLKLLTTTPKVAVRF
jgi:hypothetical protein